VAVRPSLDVITSESSASQCPSTCKHSVNDVSAQASQLHGTGMPPRKLNRSMSMHMASKKSATGGGESKLAAIAKLAASEPELVNSTTPAAKSKAPPPPPFFFSQLCIGTAPLKVRAARWLLRRGGGRRQGQRRLGRTMTAIGMGVEEAVGAPQSPWQHRSSAPNACAGAR
jgi:hypothetical protein